MDHNLEESLNLGSGLLVDFAHDTGDILGGDSELQNVEPISLPSGLDFGQIDEAMLTEAGTLTVGEEFNASLEDEIPAVGTIQAVYTTDDVTENGNEGLSRNSLLKVITKDMKKSNEKTAMEKKFIMTKQFKPLIPLGINKPQQQRIKEIPIAPKPIIFPGGQVKCATTLKIGSAQPYGEYIEMKKPKEDGACYQYLKDGKGHVYESKKVGGKQILTKVDDPTRLMILPKKEMKKPKEDGACYQYLKDGKGHVYQSKEVGGKQILTKVDDPTRLMILPTKGTSTGGKAPLITKMVTVSSGKPQSQRYITIPQTSGHQKVVVQKFVPGNSSPNFANTQQQSQQMRQSHNQATTSKKVVIAPQTVKQGNQVVRIPQSRFIQLVNEQKTVLTQDEQGNIILRKVQPSPQTVVIKKSATNTQKMPFITSKVVKIAPANKLALLNLASQKSSGQSLLLNQLTKDDSAKLESATNEKSRAKTSLLKNKEEVVENVQIEMMDVEEIELTGQIIEHQPAEPIKEETLLNNSEAETKPMAAESIMETTEVSSSQVLNDMIEIELPMATKQEEVTEENGVPESSSEQQEDEVMENLVEEKSHANTMKRNEDGVENTSMEYESTEDDNESVGKMVALGINEAQRESCPSIVDLRPYSPSSQPLSEIQLSLAPRRRCNCNKSQCLKLYCDCFANGEFCNSCNCFNCFNNLENEEYRQKAIKSCLERNPKAFRPKIGKKKDGPMPARQHNKGCNCRRSGCLKNYCECFEARIACTAMCRCIGCRNLEDGDCPSPLPKQQEKLVRHLNRPAISYLTGDVIEAVCGCLVAAGSEHTAGSVRSDTSAAAAVLRELAKCLREVISASSKLRSKQIESN